MARKPDKRPLMAFLKVQEAHEREMLYILRRSAANIDQELVRLAQSQGVGAIVRRAQLRETQRSIQRELVRLWTLLGSQVEADRVKAAIAAVDVMAEYDEVLLRAVPRADVNALRRAARATAERGVASVESRALGLSKRPLSARVYRSRVTISGQLDRLIDNALARGASPAELAREVRGFVNPRTPGGVRYAAMRLARTEINNAFHATSVRHAQTLPWITDMKWNLSGSHKVPDECNEYAESVHYDSGDVGHFKKAEVPGKPHPQCLCYVTPETVDKRSFQERYEAGQYDRAIDQLMAGDSVTI